MADEHPTVDVEADGGAPGGTVDGGADDAGHVGPTAGATDRLPPSVWGMTAAALTLVYVVWYIVDLFVLARTPTASAKVHQQLGGLVPRLVFVVLGIAALHHALDGARRALGDLFPRWRARDAGLRAVAGFLTFAVGLPAGLVLVWPAVRAWRGA